MPQVGIVMGSRSDEQVMEACGDVLESFGISYEIRVHSAHRTPEKARDYAVSARERGIQVLIAAAGGAAHLPGVLASWTSLPIIGVPLATSELRGIDSLYSIVQMPPGLPVATVSVGAWGARNAGYLAAQIIALQDERVRAAYDAYRAKLAEG